MRSGYGELNLIIGCMFSGKTSLLINRYNRYTIGNKKCLMVKFQRDTRYDSYHVTTHDGISINSVKCEYLYEIDDIIYKYNVVCIDEIQFYLDAHIMCDKWANEGVIVNACGLSGDFNRNPFAVISKLIPLADDIVFTKAVCRLNGNNAVYSKLNNNEPRDNYTQEQIGGAEKYNAVDRETYFGVFNNTFDLYKKFAEFYVNTIDNTTTVDELIDKYRTKQNFKQMIKNSRYA
jgi:thymidine kinase